ncbi:MAG TPA: PAS domain S-box protein, partial [Aestuariivirga sp.]|nr:PAS domain S-box protein [Aestuariivirga sp.]
MSESPKNTKQLRRAAEARLEEIAAHKETDGTAFDQAKLIHELQVHQIEMEMQSESLKMAIAALEASHNRYLDLYELSPVGYLTLTPTGEIAEINMTGAQLFGLDRSGLLKRDFSAFVSREDSERWRQFFQSVVRQGGDGKAEFRLVRNDLNLIDLRLDCLAVRREPEEFVIHVAMTDITARMDAEKRLRDKEHLFRVIAERLDGFVAVLDAKGQRVYNSPSYERLLGPRDSIGTNSFLEIHPDDRQRVMQAFSETVASGIGQLLEYRFLLPDGSVRIMESRGGVAWDAVGKTQYVVVISNDVTERKEAERKIHRLAFYDALTKLPNRLTLNDRLQQAMAAS